ncbi:MAG TPA: hypothetical protein PKY35_02665 [Candidatus Hydrogenedentes bacterium]|mgnify:CR=1 FL=1|nr:hypothetical protein [Candidatus Hydrogenedentota bacterium]HOL75904.1 hypothetical protein [Candidatus Hydrogenedentota bacterium]
MVFVATAASLILWVITNVGPCEEKKLELVGLTVTPHVRADIMQYRKETEPAEGARVQLFFKNISQENDVLTWDSRLRVLFNGLSPDVLLTERTWAWHDLPSATPEESFTLPKDSLVVWSFNGRRLPFGVGGEIQLDVGATEEPWFSNRLILSQPALWISSITFFAREDVLYPDLIAVHIANNGDDDVFTVGARLWLPTDPNTPRILSRQLAMERIEGFNGWKNIPKKDRGGFIAVTPPLPLTYAAVEVLVEHQDKHAESLWTFLRIKPERFDISGGWVNDAKNSITKEPFLKTLKRLHVNTAHIAETPGYSDSPLYEKYPLKYFNKLTPFHIYDADAQLPRIHAVEFLGEPQYGGGRPVPPQEVWRELYPYTKTRLPTTVTNSEERVWRDYAGLSDFPHYDAYRVSAPSADAWRKYDRWGDQRIGWGAPLETIGDMCRSLREMNRPMPCAIWSQGPHEGWDVYDKRRRTSPTTDEIRLQAYHALSTRITSLYWFNLSLRSLVKWRDTLGELGRIGREIRMLDEFMLEGDAYAHSRLRRPDGAFDWDTASVCGPRAALLFALDLDYVPDPYERVFRFGPPRPASWRFALPAYLSEIQDVFRVDANGTYDVPYSFENGLITIQDTINKVGIYLAAARPGTREYIEEKRKRLIEEEQSLEFDPANNDEHFAQLLSLVKDRER